MLSGASYIGGFRWPEFNQAYPIILVLNKLGIVHLRLGRHEAYM